MAYNNDNRGGGPQGPPRKFIEIGSLWADADKQGNWMAKGSIGDRTEKWMIALMLSPNCKISVITNQFKDSERHPDLKFSISIPEDELPQAYWDWEDARQAARQDRNGGGYSRGSAPPARGGDRYPERGTPAQAPARGGYARPAPTRGEDRAPVSRGDGGGYPERGASAQGRMVRQAEPTDQDYEDPFAE